MAVATIIFGLGGCLVAPGPYNSPPYNAGAYGPTIVMGGGGYGYGAGWADHNDGHR